MLLEQSYPARTARRGVVAIKRPRQGRRLQVRAPLRYHPTESAVNGQRCHVEVQADQGRVE